MIVTTVSVQLQDDSLNRATVLEGIHGDNLLVMDGLFLQGKPEQFRSLAKTIEESFPLKTDKDQLKHN